MCCACVCVCVCVQIVVWRGLVWSGVVWCGLPVCLALERYCYSNDTHDCIPRPMRLVLVFFIIVIGRTSSSGSWSGFGLWKGLDHQCHRVSKVSIRERTSRIRCFYSYRILISTNSSCEQEGNLHGSTDPRALNATLALAKTP